MIKSMPKSMIRLRGWLKELSRSRIEISINEINPDETLKKIISKSIYYIFQDKSEEVVSERIAFANKHKDEIRNYRGIIIYLIQQFPECKNEVIKYIKNKYDCISFEPTTEFESDLKNYKNYVVFNPNQVKLADGTNTTFDSNNDDIRYEYGGNIDLKINEKYKTLMNDENFYPFDIFNEKNEKIGKIELMYRKDLGGYQISNSNVFEKGKGIGKKAYLKLRQILGKPIISDSSRTNDAEYLWKSLEKNNYAKYDQEIGKYKIYTKGGNIGEKTEQKDNMKKTVINWSEYYKAGGEIPDNIKSKIYDSNGERRIDKKAIQTLTNYAESLPQTKDANLDRNGDYTASRKKLHQRIINSFKDELVCIQKKEPIAILMGGSPASGKSTFLRKYAPYLLKEEILKVDADEIRAMLPEYKGWNATSTHLETKDIVNTLLSDRTIGIPCKYDVIYDGTMNNTKSYIPLIKLLKDLGYKIFIVYIDRVPEEVVKKRALERYKKSGRFVPEAVIDDFFTRGKAALNELKSKADGYMIIDGSDGNYTVIEQEGMRLPKRRLYSQLGQPIKEVSKKK